MTKLRAGLAVLLLALVSVWFAASPAKADSDAPITSYDVSVNLTPEGVARVKVNFTVDFSAVRGRGPIIILPMVQDDGANPEEQYVFSYTDIKVTSSSGANTTVSKQSDSNGIALRIGHEDIFNNGPENYTLSYNATGFIASKHKDSGLDEFSWNAIGPVWKSQIRNVTVQVTGPADVQQTACFYGRGYSTPCGSSKSGPSANYSVDALSPGEPMQVVAGFPAGTFGGVEQQKRRNPSVGNAFKLSPVTGGVAGVGLVAALGGLAAIRRRHTRDEVYLGLTPGLTPVHGEPGNIGRTSGKVPVTVQFNPPKGSTPGEIGTLMDTTADKVDVSATLVDLAVRGYLKIESNGDDEFVLYATHPSQPDRLAPFESQLLVDVFQGQPTVTSGDLRGIDHQHDLSTARTGLYKSVFDKGWFKSNPASAQSTPVIVGAGFVVAAFAVAFGLWMSGWSLVSIPLAVFGIGLIVMSPKFRTRTPSDRPTWPKPRASSCICGPPRRTRCATRRARTSSPSTCPTRWSLAWPPAGRSCSPNWAQKASTTPTRPGTSAPTSTTGSRSPTP